MKLSIIFLIIFVINISASGQTDPEMRDEDKIRIKEAMNISNQYGDKIWKGINDVPFVMILVTDSVEFLINHPNPSSDFNYLGYDSILNSKIFYRQKQYPINFLATFPAVNGVNTIVCGTPENTGKNSTDWIITLLHEHFHEYEYTYPDYAESVDKLDLSGGDKTGMWMLNFPFPYDSIPVNYQYEKYISALLAAVSDTDSKSFNADFNKYLTERNIFKNMLKPDDYKYFSFQVWQEGIARYTEYKFLESLSDYDPSAEVAQLQDFIPFNMYREEFYRSQLKQLDQLTLKEDKRVCFYAVGFAEGILLDRLNPGWHKEFLKDKFYVEHYRQ